MKKNKNNQYLSDNDDFDEDEYDYNEFNNFKIKNVKYKNDNLDNKKPRWQIDRKEAKKFKQHIYELPD